MGSGGLKSRSQILGHGFRVPPALFTFLTLPNQVGVYLGLMPKIPGNSTVYFVELESVKILADRFGRIPATEGVDQRVERNARTRDVVGTVPFFDVLSHCGYSIIGFRPVRPYMTDLL